MPNIAQNVDKISSTPFVLFCGCLDRLQKQLEFCTVKIYAAEVNEHACRSCLPAYRQVSLDKSIGGIEG